MPDQEYTGGLYNSGYGAGYNSNGTVRGVGGASSSVSGGVTSNNSSGVSGSVSGGGGVSGSAGGGFSSGGGSWGSGFGGNGGLAGTTSGVFGGMSYGTRMGGGSTLGGFSTVQGSGVSSGGNSMASGNVTARSPAGMSFNGLLGGMGGGSATTGMLGGSQPHMAIGAAQMARSLFGDSNTAPENNNLGPRSNFGAQYLRSANMPGMNIEAPGSLQTMFNSAYPVFGNLGGLPMLQPAAPGSRDFAAPMGMSYNPPMPGPSASQVMAYTADGVPLGEPRISKDQSRIAPETQVAQHRGAGGGYGGGGGGGWGSSPAAPLNIAGAQGGYGIQGYTTARDPNFGGTLPAPQNMPVANSGYFGDIASYSGSDPYSAPTDGTVVSVDDMTENGGMQPVNQPSVNYAPDVAPGQQSGMPQSVDEAIQRARYTFGNLFGGMEAMPMIDQFARQGGGGTPPDPQLAGDNPAPIVTEKKTGKGKKDERKKPKWSYPKFIKVPYTTAGF